MIVAHRGASSTHPENTLEAFRAAGAVGADFVELDVRLTADHVAVVLHDADVSRTTDGTGFVNEMTLAEVKALDASGDRGLGLEVPTLEEVLLELSRVIGVDVEIKNHPGEPGYDSPGEAVAAECVRLIRETDFQGEVILSSFNASPIERVRELAPDIPTGFITTAVLDPWEVLAYATSQGHAFILPQAPAIYEAGSALLESAHEAGVRVGAWTVDDPDAVDRLFALGVDAVATNDPAMGVAIRERHRSGFRTGR